MGYSFVTNTMQISLSISFLSVTLHIFSTGIQLHDDVSYEIIRAKNSLDNNLCHYRDNNHAYRKFPYGEL